MISIAHAAEGASGLPQFDSSTFSSQFFWTVASFIVLVVLLKKYVIPAINDILDARGKQIGDDMDNAEKLRKEADKVLAEYQEKLSMAGETAAKTIEAARMDAARFREDAHNKLEAELGKKKEAALAEIEQTKQKAMADVKNTAVDVAMLATEKLISKAVTKTDANKMVQAALEQLKSDGKQLH
ncbi:MAG: F0F1 ATP synthase subunit B [Magnetococcales bacterium]|nr:F0F1 ATP synthase subunit B [Magnetococcales bacterium]